MTRVIFQQRITSVCKVLDRLRKCPIEFPKLWRGEMLQISEQWPDLNDLRAASANESSLPDEASFSNCRSHASASKSQNHLRKSLSSSGLSPWIFFSISCSLLILITPWFPCISLTKFSYAGYISLVFLISRCPKPWLRIGGCFFSIVTLYICRSFGMNCSNSFFF